MVRRICVNRVAVLLFFLCLLGLGATPRQAVAARSNSAATTISEYVTPAQAAQIFKLMAAQSDIPFKYPKDGCYARSHAMEQRILGLRIRPIKVWAFPLSTGESLVAKTPHDPRGYVTWSYHVAPCVRVRDSYGKIQAMVIDPSLFRQPVSVATWTAAMPSTRRRHAYVTCTRLNVAPTGPNGRQFHGSGYVPGDDPKEGIARNAQITLHTYKRLEQYTAWTYRR